MNLSKKACILKALLLVALSPLCAQTGKPNIKKTDSLSVREHLLMDFGWRFAFGHPYDTNKDFNNGTSYFSYMTKTGYGDGAASANFDDRSWRKIDLPHDWVVEQAFSGSGSHSHGYMQVGRNFPETSVGWYRKSVFIPETDLGKRISVEFDGVHRNSIVWVNGFYVGHEPSGYNGFEYDITDYINYGGNNVIAVRADATLEEGWFYEGAGIYRHTWLNKTAPLHVARYGTFVTSQPEGNIAKVKARATIINEGRSEANFYISQTIIDAEGKTVATAQLKALGLKALEEKEFPVSVTIQNPKLWSIETPYLYKLITIINQGGKTTDTYETKFGIRTIRFDAKEGFFLNGKHVKIVGTNNHQDHAGVGTAIPDALQDFRIATLKSMGSNAYRCSHNPPTPELIDACDRLGMLILPENRLMGSNTEHLELLKRMIYRDRNHPSVIAWSIGNEEWEIESNIKGARITATMQAYAQKLDSSRRVTVAISGGCGYGSSETVDIMGFNYLTQCDIDDYHKKHPDQVSMGTEETTTQGTRGVYKDDRSNGRMAGTDRDPSSKANIEIGWKFYDERPFLSGLFYWTGFDYRGEPNPLGWPAVSSQFGIIDVCGFPKDVYYYLKSRWTDAPVLHLLPHWNWKGQEGQEINVLAQTNCDEVELFLNGKTLGRKTLPKNGHLEWIVKYTPGVLLARGYKAGKEIIIEKLETTGTPAAVKLTANRNAIKADGEDVSILTVNTNDAKGLLIPTGDNEITFSIQGPGKIIGVGNGDPASHDPDKFIETIKSVKIENLKEKEVDGIENRAEVAADFNDTGWNNAFKDNRNDKFGERVKALVYRGTFQLPEKISDAEITLFYTAIGKEQLIYINGQPVTAASVKENKGGYTFVISKSIIHPGKNSISIVATPLLKKYEWEGVNTNAGLIQVVIPPAPYKRKLFSGLAQVIVQSTKEAGEITLTAGSPGLKQSVLKIQTKPVALRPSVESK